MLLMSSRLTLTSFKSSRKCHLSFNPSIPAGLGSFALLQVRATSAGEDWGRTLHGGGLDASLPSSPNLSPVSVCTPGHRFFWEKNSLRPEGFPTVRCSPARQQGAHQPCLEDARQGWGAVLAVKHESHISRRPLLCMMLQHELPFHASSV